MDRAALEHMREGLFQPSRGLYIAPVRHHSPACAFALRAMIRKLRPATVLIEAPIDFTPHIELLLHKETVPPIAIAATIEQSEAGGEAGRVAGYYPFCAHSPEYVALVEAHKVSGEARFIDLPSAQKAMRRGAGGDRPVALLDELEFTSSDFTNALARRLGCRDGFELWDHLFETRIGKRDWQGLFADIGAYCAGIRAATPDAVIEAEGDLAREAHMAACIAEALKEGGPVVVVVGGFHAPALIERLADETSPAPRDRAPAAKSYIIRYGFAALDALNGYAAGLPQPAYYDHLWKAATRGRGALNWRELSGKIAQDFALSARKRGYAVSVPAQVEMLRVAETLAKLRGRPGALRHDLFDGLTAALVKDEGVYGDAWTEQFTLFLRGDALGDVPAEAGSPPLVEDARRLARLNRLDISNGQRRQRKLDIRRKPAHLAASQYFHAMALLSVGFAVRESGPDFVNNARTDLLFEEWAYAWSPQVEGALVECAVLGDQLPTACLAKLRLLRRDNIEQGKGDALDELVKFFAHGLLAGLGARLAPFLVEIAGDIEQRGEFGTIVRALRRLHMIALSKGPLSAPEALDIHGVRAAAYRRLVYLCDDLPETAPDMINDRLSALRLMVDLLRGPEGDAFDKSLFEDALSRVALADPPAEILGAVLAIGVFATECGANTLRVALEGRLAGATPDLSERIGVLRGMLIVDPTLLWRVDGLLDAVDAFLMGLEEEAFLELLPHLRLAFTALTPRETDQVAALLAQIHGGSDGAFSQRQIAAGESDLARGAAIERRLRASLDVDGLEAWLAPQSAAKEGAS